MCLGAQILYRFRTSHQVGRIPTERKLIREGCSAHKIKKKTRNLLGGGTFDHEFLVLWSVLPGTDSAVREKQNPVFRRKQDPDDSIHEKHHITPQVSI